MTTIFLGVCLLFSLLSCDLQHIFLCPLQVVCFVYDKAGDDVLDALVIFNLPVEQRHPIEGTSSTSMSDDILTFISTFEVDYDC